MKWAPAWLLLIGLAACGRGTKERSALAPTPVAQTASPDELDRLWDQGVGFFRKGDWKHATETFGRRRDEAAIAVRVGLVSPGDEGRLRRGVLRCRSAQARYGVAGIDQAQGFLSAGALSGILASLIEDSPLSIAGEPERLVLAAAIESNRILLSSARICKYILCKCEQERRLR